MIYNRTSGILLHPTSLPSLYGIGDFGPSAYDFVDFLSRSAQQLWQMLPLGPTGYGDSPYQALSAFAGNTLLISPDLLLREGLLMPEDIIIKDFSEDRVAFEQVIVFKNALLDKAFRRFEQQVDHRYHQMFSDFCTQEAAWLDDFVLFLALKHHHKSRAWTQWPNALKLREKQALDA